MLELETPAGLRKQGSGGSILGCFVKRFYTAAMSRHLACRRRQDPSGP